MNTFELFTPVKKLHFTNNRVVYSLLVICFLPISFDILVLGRQSLFSKTVAIIGISIYLFIRLIFGIYGHIKSKPLKGIIKGEIVFESKLVKVANQDFYVENLKKIEIPIYNDYKGRVEKYIRHNLNGRESNGVDNTIKLYLVDDTELTFHFQLSHRYQLRDIREQLIIYHKAGKFDFENLILILGLEDYNAVQNFKKSLSVKTFNA